MSLINNNPVNPDPELLQFGLVSHLQQVEEFLRLETFELLTLFTLLTPSFLTLLCPNSLLFVTFVLGESIPIFMLHPFVVSIAHNKLRTLGLKYPLLVKRLACMVVTGAASVDCIDILQPAHVLPEIEVEYSLLRRAFEDINLPKDNLKFLTEQWYADALARVRINAFRIEMVAGSYEDLLTMATASVEAEAGVGNAVYILPSFYNHDCDPNVHIIWTDSVHAKLKALRDIEEGEELRICYIDASLDYNARQDILLGGFGFKCSCNRCLSHD